MANLILSNDYNAKHYSCISYKSLFYSSKFIV